MTPNAPLAVAVVGCGRAAENLHLPVLAYSDDIALRAFVDVDTERATELATAYGVHAVVTDVAELPDDVEAAVLVLPHHLHAPVAIELLKAGIHVLVEKPMALDVKGCLAMQEAAARSDAVLAIGLVRRLFPGMRLLRHFVESGYLGQIERVSVAEGTRFRWDVASDFTLRADRGGGVLFDSGAHVLDLMTWIFGSTSNVRYRDDARGGVAANCVVDLEFDDGFPARIELSRTRDLRNTIEVKGSHGELSAGLGLGDVVVFRMREGNVLRGWGLGSDDRQSMPGIRDLLYLQATDFASAIRDARPPAAPPEEGVRSVAIIEQCLASRRPLELPWLEPEREGVRAT